MRTVTRKRENKSPYKKQKHAYLLVGGLQDFVERRRDLHGLGQVRLVAVVDEFGDDVERHFLSLFP